VGGVTASLAASEGAHAVIVTSRDKQAAQTAADALSRKTGLKIFGEAARDEKERLALMKEADIAAATVKAGVRVVSLAGLASLERGLIVADVNAVPPAGFEGLEPHDEMKQIAPNVRGIGALAIGALKYKVEAGLFKAMLERGAGAGYIECYELAKTLA